MRGELAGLEHEGVARGQARRDLPGGLQQRVVPRRDQPADADRLVHDAADHVRPAGVDDPAGVLGRDVGVVPEHRRRRRRRRTRSRPGACRCPGTRRGRRRPCRARAGPRPGAAARPRSRADEPGQPPSSKAARAASIAAAGVLGSGLVDLRDERPVSRTADLPTLALASPLPSTPDVELWHVDCPIRDVSLRMSQLRVFYATELRLRPERVKPLRRSVTQVVSTPRRRCPGPPGRAP